MWIVSFLLSLGALHCTVSSSPPSPINVIFSSVNLRNVLQWFPGSGTPDDTHFIVQYAIYGDRVEGKKNANWRAVRSCTKIARSWCDLSNETWDLEEGYYARVRAVSRRASSEWVVTRRFDPKTDTFFGPPLVSVKIEDNNAIITLKGPMRYQPDNRTPAVSMTTLYPQMTYNLSIDNTRRGQMHHFLVSSSSYKYRLMQYNTEYCFSAKTKFFSMPAQCNSSAWHCITTPQDPVIVQLQRVVVGIVVPSVCMCMLVLIGYLLYRYLSGKGQKSPYILNPPDFHLAPLTFPPENPKLIIITIIKELQPGSGISGPACPKKLRHIAHPSPGYASQRPETPPEVEEPCDDLSVDYGFIDVAPQIDVTGEDGNNPKVEHQKYAARNNYEKKEWSVRDGQSAGHTQTHAQTEMRTLIQAHARSQPVLPTQTQAPLPFQRATMGEVEEDREIPVLLINTTPQTGLFCMPLDLQTDTMGRMGEGMDGKVEDRTDGEINGGVEASSECEQVPLLSAYASQNTNVMPTSTDQSDLLPDDYGVLRLDTAHNIEEGDEEEEEEGGTICVHWDPQTRKLLLPEIAMEFNKEERFNWLMQGEKRSENRMGGEEEEEVNSMKGKLRLENVYVRQGSEEKKEAQREMERGEGMEWEVDDFLTRWNLVISMDQ